MARIRQRLAHVRHDNRARNNEGKRERDKYDVDYTAAERLVGVRQAMRFETIVRTSGHSGSVSTIGHPSVKLRNVR